MTKEELLQSFADSIDDQKDRKARNSMGVSEGFYNPFYLIARCFTLEELSAMSQKQLDSLLKLAKFASDVFY